MSFAPRGLKGWVTDVGNVISRAKQYAEETLGTSERTEYDREYELLAQRADCCKQWTEKIIDNLEALVEPNPNLRYSGMIIEKIGNTEIIKRDRPRIPELLGNDMIEAGVASGPNTLYGSTLIKVGKLQTFLGQTEKNHVQNTYRTIILPLKKFLEEDMKTIMKERKVLEAKRLDLDAAKNRHKKAKNPATQVQAQNDIKICQQEYKKQYDITKLLLEGISSAQANHVRCLNDFVQAQMEYYKSCMQCMSDFQADLAQPKNQENSKKAKNESLKLSTGQDNSNSNPAENGDRRKAKCLDNYTANNNDELSLEANEIIFVYSIGSDGGNDWMMGEKADGKKGKVPVAYLEILN